MWLVPRRDDGIHSKPPCSEAVILRRIGLSLIKPGLFALVLVAFALPWMTLECAGVISEPVTGLDIATDGFERKMDEWAAEVNAQTLLESSERATADRTAEEWQLYVRIIAGIAVAGVCFTLYTSQATGRRRENGTICGLLGLAGLAACGYFWYEVSNTTREVIIVYWKLGFWLAILSFGAAAYYGFSDRHS